MRGKIARELRKIAKFNSQEKREYETWKIPCMKYILSYDPKTKQATPTKRVVDAEIMECVSKPRKVYKHVKKFYKGYTEEAQFNVLPEENALEDIRQQMTEEQKALSKEVKDGRANSSKEEI